MSGGSEEGGGEKVFDATPQRLEEARRRGDVPKSADATVALTYLGLLVVAGSVGAAVLDRAAATLLVLVAHPDRLEGKILGPGGRKLSAEILGEALWALAPLLLLPITALFLSLFAQQALVFSGEKLHPKLSRISMLGNARQKFGPSGLVEFLKSAIKLIAIAAALLYYIAQDLDAMIGAATADAAVLGAFLMESFLVLLAVTCVIAVTIAAIDVVWQRFDHGRKLRMSLQEMRDEHKASEGDPHVKAQRRSRAEKIATNRMLLDVPKADVVIVNPTHYAVALKWTRAKGSAPLCVAKGEDEVALRIRELAATAGIPIHSDPPTARALHATVEIGREVAPEHYRAVAAAIRFADRMRKAARARPAGGRPA